MPADFNNDPEFRGVPSKPKPPRKFRLLELLAVLFIVGMLLSLLLTGSRSARVPGRRLQCASILRQIGLGLHNYELLYKALPPAYTVDANGKPLHSWRTLILPFLDERSTYEKIDLTKPWNDPANAEAYKSMPGVFRCPSAGCPPNTTTYLAVVGTKNCFLPDRPRSLSEITDDHAKTLMVIEAGSEQAVHWMSPVDADEALVLSIGPKTKLAHSGGVNACFVDGGIRFVSVNLSEISRRALISVSGNDHVDADEFD